MYAEEKTVTRRWGWYDAKPGDRFRAVEKCMGLKKGEKVKEIYIIEVVKAFEEPLRTLVVSPETDHVCLTYGQIEMTKEGFPNMQPLSFVSMLKKIKPKKLNRDHPMRIEFKRVIG